MTEFLTSVAFGLGVGSVYALLALGFAFIFRTTASFNFAQGQFLTYGSLFAYTLYTAVGLPALLAVVVVAVIVGLLGGLVERVAIYPLVRRGDDTLTWLMSTLGVAVLLTGIAERIWGTLPLGVNNYLGSPITHIGSVNLSTPYVLAIGAALIATLAIEVFLRFTLWGRAMRAVGDNRLAVELAGINIRAVGFVAFVAGGALAGIAGFVLAPVTYAESTTGFNFTILAFTALAIGSFSSHWGALFGGWLVGLIESLSGTYVGLNYQDIIVFAALVVILMVRPEGLSNLRASRRV